MTEDAIIMTVMFLVMGTALIAMIFSGKSKKETPIINSKDGKIKDLFDEKNILNKRIDELEAENKELKKKLENSKVEHPPIIKQSPEPIIFTGSQSIDVRYALSDLEIKELLKRNISWDIADKLIESDALELSETFDETTQRKVVTYRLRVLPAKGGFVNDTQTKDI